MRVGGLTGRVAVGLLTLTGGCGQMLDGIKPDRISFGAAARQIEGDYRGSKIKTAVTVWEMRAKKKLTDSLDVSGRVQFNQGTLKARHGVLEGKAGGEFESVGVGLNYFPLDTRMIGLDIGMEAFHAEYKMQGEFGLFRQVTPDRFWGGGANLGVVGEIPLAKGKNWRFVWGAGYNFTETNTGKARADLDGWYGIIGIEISLPGKK